jgi:hypothetical protein
MGGRSTGRKHANIERENALLSKTKARRGARKISHEETGAARTIFQFTSAAAASIGRSAWEEFVFISTLDVSQYRRCNRAFATRGIAAARYAQR